MITNFFYPRVSSQCQSVDLLRDLLHRAHLDLQIPRVRDQVSVAVVLEHVDTVIHLLHACQQDQDISRRLLLVKVEYVHIVQCVSRHWASGELLL